MPELAWREVRAAEWHSGRGSVLGPDTYRRAHWWDLLLECGHRVQRSAHRRGEDWQAAPRRVSCAECLATPYMYVRVETMTRAGLTPDQLTGAAALAVTELGVAEGLVMIHGPERGARRYFEAGGCVRFDAAGNPWVPVTPGGVKTSVFA